MFDVCQMSDSYLMWWVLVKVTSPACRIKSFKSCKSTQCENGSVKARAACNRVLEDGEILGGAGVVEAILEADLPGGVRGEVLHHNPVASPGPRWLGRES